MNNLPESIQKKISDEAEAATRERERILKEAKKIPLSSEYCDGWADGYEVAATGILRNPGDWNLAPSPRIAQLEQALEKIANMDASRTYRHSCWEMKEIATNALKTDNP